MFSKYEKKCNLVNKIINFPRKDQTENENNLLTSIKEKLSPTPPPRAQSTICSCSCDRKKLNTSCSTRSFTAGWRAYAVRTNTSSGPMP